MERILKRIYLVLILCVITGFTFMGCEDNSKKTKITEAYETADYEKIGFPVRLQSIERGGMNYIIASGTYGESGVDICNITLDSLMVEYYKQELN